MENFTLTINTKEIQKSIEEDFKNKIKKILEAQSSGIFKEPRSWIKGDKGGIGFQLITEKAEEHFLSDNSQKFITDYIEANWEKVLTEATAAAMQKAASHQANRLAFKNIGERQAALKAEKEKQRND